MAYVKKYKGERETGNMVPCIITGDDGVERDLGSYPETEKVYETVWEQDWLPEHMPVGSVVRYCLEHRKDGVKEAVVTGHYQNGVKSWVVQTDEPCSIFGAPKKESFNASYVTEVVSRGTGTVRFSNHTVNVDQYWINDYRYEQGHLPPSVKRPHLYAANTISTVVGYVLHTHPAFKELRYDCHIHMPIYELVQQLSKYFTVTRLDKWGGYCTIKKKRLIRELRNLMAHNRKSKASLLKQEKQQQHEDYERDMRSFFNDTI